jgi:hypothetical protein
MRFGVTMASIGLFVVAGCGKSDWGYLEGTVLLNGKPIGPAVISLQPVDAQRAGGVGPVDEKGKYKVVSARKKEGAAVGDYRVTVHSKLSDFGFEQPAKKAAIPARYENPDTSGLTVKVEPGTKQFDIELKP